MHLCAYSAGKTLAENLAALPGLKEGQEVILPVETPIKETGHLQVLDFFLAQQSWPFLLSLMLRLLSSPLYVTL